MKKKSFTLVEIMIVVAIIAILAAIAVPSLSANRTSAQTQTKIANTKVVNSAVVQVLAGNPALAASGVTDTLIQAQLGVSDYTSFTVGGAALTVVSGQATYATASQ